MVTLALDHPDPLARALLPPKDETPADRWAREQREAHARLISDQIDAQLKAERAALRKKGKPIKVLLLGQSESGKSTTVKNFQLTYAYSQFIEERSAWRAVIHLNLVRSVNTVLDVLVRELSRSSSQPHSPRSSSPTRSPRLSTARPSTSTTVSASTSRGANSGTGTISGDTLVPDLAPFVDGDGDDDADDDDAATWSTPVPLSDAHRRLQLRLTPLRQVQRDLERSLGAASTEAPEYAGVAAPWERTEAATGRRPREFAVTSRTGWKTALRRVASGCNAARRASFGSREEARAEHGAQDSARRPRSRRRPTRPTSPFGISTQDGNEDEQGGGEGQGEPQARSAADVLASCATDMAALWADEGVQAVLARRKMRARLEEGPGFFLDDVARVTARDYEPSDEDVVRARLRTMGVQEYRFKFDKGLEADREWILYDVGGARSLRHAWYPYFDDINALIFLAPISCFDERLAEDRRTNRLQDSLLLWKAVCGSALLAKVQLILFLNKCDLLERKLQRGVQLAHYVTSYGTRANDAKTAAKYFRQQFKDIFLKQSPEKRTFYSYLTSVVDTKATAVTVATVHDGIQRQYMRDADIL